jgi:hypothetical protein
MGLGDFGMGKREGEVKKRKERKIGDEIGGKGDGLGIDLQVVQLESHEIEGVTIRSRFLEIQSRI